MDVTALLVIIYLAFISLGLPDSILGSAWPVIRLDLSAPVSLVGYLAMAVSAGTVVSSLFSSRLVARLGTAKVTIISVFMTAAALLGFAFAKQAAFLFLLAIPLGLGAGSVDAALNNFVALHYKSMHMNWLHCFWGVGATAGPMIMSFFLANGRSWRMGYGVIAALQFALVAALWVSRGLWQGRDSGAQSEQSTRTLSNREALQMPNVKLALVGFICFSITEITAGLWSSTYLVGVEGMAPAVAARWTAAFYGGITIGRLLSGFLSMRLANPALIRGGQLVCVLGAVLLMLPLPASASALGFVLIGFGTAPIFPAMLHETPRRFGAEVSGAVMGLQMAVAYTGGTFGSPLFGALASLTSLRLLPYYLLAAVLVMLAASELLERRLAGGGKDHG
ncbi:MAG: MFS transporter [Firmicutes bacterium]|nr:MFS transporter [Bacillota bacterium]